jgi:hypothetical protein
MSPMADDKGGDNYKIHTENQSGGTNISRVDKLYVNQNPPTKLEASIAEENVPDNGLFRTTFDLSLTSPQGAPRLHVEAHAPSVVSAHLRGGSPIQMMVMEGTGDQMAFASVGNPGPSYKFVVRSKKPEKFRLTYNFEGFNP